MATGISATPVGLKSGQLPRWPPEKKANDNTELFPSIIKIHRLTMSSAAPQRCVHWQEAPKSFSSDFCQAEGEYNESKRREEEEAAR